MRRPLAIFLTLLSAWISVPSGLSALVICLHPDEGAHVELVGAEAVDCTESEPELGRESCPPCLDFVVQSADIGPVRSSDLATAGAKAPGTKACADRLQDSRLIRGQAVALKLAPRGPPVAPPVAAWIRETVVLRL